MTMDVGPQSKAAVTSGAGAPAGSSPKASRQRNMILVGIGLGLVLRVLRDPRFYTYAITAIILLVTGGKAAKENQSRSIDRLVEWNKRQTQRVEHKVKEATRDVKEALPG
jgi:hypothetical protein